MTRQPGQGARAGQTAQLTVKRRFPGGQLDDVTTRLSELETAVVEIGRQLRRVVETGDVPT